MSEGDWKNNAAERKAVLPAAGKARKAIFCQTSGFKQDICDSIAQYSKDRGRKAIFCQTSGLKQDISDSIAQYSKNRGFQFLHPRCPTAGRSKEAVACDRVMCTKRFSISRVLEVQTVDALEKSAISP